ncbi:MAG: hypothetical protein M1826_002029 [Phylliscum demangeonii]|nr:MAG: hypothetical protein M1826_002029 [Phylliscum demangeonii]
MEHLSLEDPPPLASGPGPGEQHAPIPPAPSGPPQLPAQMFTTAAQLLDLTDKKLMVVLRDGRKLIGVLRSWDQFANLVLQDTVERIFIHELYADVPRGIYMVRGENVLLLGEIDLDKDDYIPEPYREAPADEVVRIQKREQAERGRRDKLRQSKLQALGFDVEGSGEVTPAPSLETVKAALPRYAQCADPPNLMPLYTTIPADLLTPSLAYLKLSARWAISRAAPRRATPAPAAPAGIWQNAICQSGFSFLFESAATTETIERFSFVGANPTKVLKTGPGHGPATDPLPLLQAQLARSRVASIPELNLPPLTGGAIGYVGYDCVRYFEPKTAGRELADIVQVPESFFMLFDTIVAFDHFYQVIKVVTYLAIAPDDDGGRHDEALEQAYAAATQQLQATVDTLLSPDIPLPPQPAAAAHGPVPEYVSNIGQAGYEAHVRRLKEHIVLGDVIQAVPSQRLSRPTILHPFNLYRHLRTVNPSPYLFYIDCQDFQLVGASPELLVKNEPAADPSASSSSSAPAPGPHRPPRRRIVTHPIAGTVKRGRTRQEDGQLAAALLSSVKDRAEHVMLVDLARNDVNRVCDPLATRVDRLMVVEKFSHVQHLVSQVSGLLRPGYTRFDAFRSIFPAGTVSGAPKVRAMQLIAELEGEKRGVYAGAVGYWGFDTVMAAPPEPKPEPEEPEPEEPDALDGDGDGVGDGGAGGCWVEEGAMDTCIALRTMLVKDGIVYLQAGGGIVFDSDPEDEYLETMNKLGANMQCISSAEERFAGGSLGAL